MNRVSDSKCCHTPAETYERAYRIWHESTGGTDLREVVRDLAQIVAEQHEEIVTLKESLGHT